MNHNNQSPPRPPADDVIQAHIGRFMAELRKADYAAETLAAKHTALKQFVQWRHWRQGHALRVTESEIGDFLTSSFAGDHSRRSVAFRALIGFLDYLRRGGVIKNCVRKDRNAGLSLEARYADFLRRDKGLAELSLKVYLPVANDLVHYLKEQHGRMAIRRLDAIILRAFLLQRAQGRSIEYVRLLATSLRSFLRFLHAQGEISHDLTAAIPAVRRSTHLGIPKTLAPSDVKRILTVPDRATATGRRDQAILLLLARLGLRSSEVLSLELGDLRWRTGEVLIRGKGHRQDLLPLPPDVGAAIARYLRRDRGVRTTRRVFLRTIAPRVPLTGPASIGHIVRRALVKAGVQRPRQVAAHLFRHTLPSRMLHHGAHLLDISQVLRHRAIVSTEIYAKIDLGALQEAVRPWPSEGGLR